MSNGHVCCLLGVCCPPPAGSVGRVHALAAELAEHCNPNGSFESISGWLLDNFDLVPKGMGDAIVEAYRPEFAKLHAHKEKTDAD